MHRNKIQTGVGDHPGVVQVHIKANIVTGVFLSLWTKSTVHGTDRQGCSPNNSGKESLNISQLTLAKRAYKPTALASKPWPKAPKLTYSLTTINSLNIYDLLLGFVANRLVNSTLNCACLGLVDCPLAISTSGCLPGLDTRRTSLMII